MYYLIAIFNCIAIFLAARNNKLNWALGIFSTIIASIMFYNDLMFTSFLFNIYSTICSIYALFKWNNSNKTNIVYTKFNVSLIIFGIIFIVLFITNKYVFHSINFVYDSIAPACAILATYFLVHKNLLSWIYWIGSDLTYIICGINCDIPRYIIIYSIMLCISVYGFIRNYKIFKFNKN